MRLSVMVLADPIASSALRVALGILESARNRGHALDTLFLYHKAAYVAVNPVLHGAAIARCTELAAGSGLKCVVCRTALLRQGCPATADGLLAPFRLGGLPDWMAAWERSDRALRFGGLA
jgi:sulfur relay (sulfurtransferase) complex TusBCD TusD component (DsrE family)